MWRNFELGPLDGGLTQERTAFANTPGLVYQQTEDGTYIFRGHNAFRCENCGSRITPPPEVWLDACPWCGADR